MSRVLPILFNTDMVRGILDGRKTVTRRLVMPHNRKKAKEQGYCQGNGLWVDQSTDNGDKEGHIKDYSISPCWMSYRWYINRYAPYQSGDILYVRETWHKYTKRVGHGENCRLQEFYGYKARIANSEDASEKWYPSIHMPKEAAQIWLKVTDVRVERLQEITIEGIRAEGLTSMAVHAGDMEIAVREWKILWDATIKKSDLAQYGWDANPWVWVIEFERCEKPAI